MIRSSGPAGSCIFCIECYRECNIISLDQIICKGRFLLCLLNINCLREEINSHLKPCCQGSLHILIKAGIFYKSAVGISSVSRTHKNELNSGSFHFLPVYIPLIV